jgi:hypothetical protein
MFTPVSWPVMQLSVQLLQTEHNPPWHVADLHHGPQGMMSLFSNYLKAPQSANVVDLSADVPLCKSLDARINSPQSQAARNLCSAASSTDKGAKAAADRHIKASPRAPLRQTGNVAAADKSHAKAGVTSWGAAQGSMFTAVYEVAELLHAVAILDRNAGQQLFSELIEYDRLVMCF